MLRLILSTILLTFPCMTATGLAATPSAETALLGGTILSIDHEALTLTLLLPTGDARALPVGTPRLLQGLSVGDHVTFELDREQAIVKLTKLPTDPAN